MQLHMPCFSEIQKRYVDSCDVGDVYSVMLLALISLEIWIAMRILLSQYDWQSKLSFSRTTTLLLNSKIPNQYR